MNSNEYTVFTRSTAAYPSQGSQTFAAMNYLGHGLGEAGEIQGKIKKLIRDHGAEMDTPISELPKDIIDAIIHEMGDLDWYQHRLADEIGITMDFVRARNVAKLQDRERRGVLGGSGDHR